MTPYRHRQVGWKLVAGVAVGLALAAWLVGSLSPATREAAPLLVYGLFGVLVVALLMYGTLTVTVDDTRIGVVFGIGVFRKTIELADVVRCEPVGIRAFWGWGLHWTPSGWLYNVGGRDGVRIVLAREKAVVIGSDDVRGLAAAIDERISGRTGRMKESRST